MTSSPSCFCVVFLLRTLLYMHLHSGRYALPTNFPCWRSRVTVTRTAVDTFVTVASVFLDRGRENSGAPA